MPEIPAQRDLQKKPIGEVVDDVMNQSQELLQRGAAVTAEVNELKRRADNALDWRKQLREHGGLVAAIGIAAAIIVAVIVVRD